MTRLAAAGWLPEHAYPPVAGVDEVAGIPRSTLRAPTRGLEGDLCDCARPSAEDAANAALLLQLLAGCPRARPRPTTIEAGTHATSHLERRPHAPRPVAPRAAAGLSPTTRGRRDELSPLALAAPARAPADGATCVRRPRTSVSVTAVVHARHGADGGADPAAAARHPRSSAMYSRPPPRPRSAAARVGRRASSSPRRSARVRSSGSGSVEVHRRGLAASESAPLTGGLRSFHAGVDHRRVDRPWIHFSHLGARLRRRRLLRRPASSRPRSRATRTTTRRRC